MADLDHHRPTGQTLLFGPRQRRNRPPLPVAGIEVPSRFAGLLALAEYAPVISWLAGPVRGHPDADPVRESLLKYVLEEEVARSAVFEVRNVAVFFQLGWEDADWEQLKRNFIAEQCALALQEHDLVYMMETPDSFCAEPGIRQAYRRIWLDQVAPFLADRVREYQWQTALGDCYQQLRKDFRPRQRLRRQLPSISAYVSAQQAAELMIELLSRPTSLTKSTLAQALSSRFAYHPQLITVS